MKKLFAILLAVIMSILMESTAFAIETSSGEAQSSAAVTNAFNEEEQLAALGKDELMQQVPEGARELMEQAQVYDISTENLLMLSPKNFFKTIWQLFLRQIKRPLVVLGTILGIIILSALLGGFGSAAGEKSLSPVFDTVSILCILASIASPILDCIIQASKAIQQASVFMLSFIPMFSASLAAAGQPITGATYNMFLFATCQVVAQVVSKTLIPLMGIFLALSIVSSLVPEVKMSSISSTIKSIVSWTLGFILTIFVAILSVQTMVAQSADSVTTRTAKFLIGSFVPVVGGALSDAYTAAQGCLRLLKTSLGAYGIIVAAMTFLPILLQTIIWYLLSNIAVMGSEVLGVSKVTSILKSCSSVLAILVAVILCYALLIIVSTTVVMVAGLGGG